MPLTITNGADPAKLLANAIALATAGTQTTPLQATLALATAQLDRQAVLAAQADAALAAAARQAADADARAAAARADASNLKGALVEAALRLYMLGPSRVPIPQDHDAQTLVDGAVYEQTILSPQGILAKRRVDANTADAAAKTVVLAREQAAAADRAATAAKDAATAAQSQIEAELTGLTAATATLISTERSDVSKQAATALTSPTALDWAPTSPLPAPVATTDVALAWVFSELGKPYTWGATGPDTFDCSGLTQFAWHAAGVDTPRVAQDQEGWTVPVPLSQLIPGDLVFYGTSSNIHHVGMYIGDGLMINAPHTGDVVRVSPMWWSDLYGFGRVHTAGTPVPIRPPTAAAPVVATAGTVPAQHAPPPGWTPTPGGSAPLPGYYPPIGTPPSSTTTSTPSSSTTPPAPSPPTPPTAPTTTIPGHP
ncbi:MAG: C40 family peptidase [Acidimicrobiales bacterium]